MGVVDKTVETAGGAAVGGVKGAVTGFASSVVLGAVLIGAAAAAGGALISVGAAVGFGIAGAAVGAAVGGAGSAPLTTLGAAVGAFIGGAKKLFSKSQDKAPAIDQQLAVERARQRELTDKLIEQRQAMAASFDNPDATVGFVAKTQPAANDPSKGPVQTQDGQTSFVAKTQAAANDPVTAQRA